MSVYGIHVPDQSIRDGIGTNSGKYSKFVQELYYLGIYDMGAGKAALYKNSEPLSYGPSSEVHDNTTPGYYFRLPPKVHESKDSFATNIIYTQENGKYIESHGSLVKEVKVSGTTGLRPHRNDAKTLKIFGFDTGASGPAAQTAEFLGLANTPDLFGAVKGVVNAVTGKKPSPWPEGEALGYDDILFLKNLFRLYAHLKSTAVAGKYAMVWRNVRDAEYWYVEPTDFTLSQSSGSPCTYDYAINLKLIAPLDYSVKLEQDPSSFLNTLRNTFYAVNKASAVIKQSFQYIAATIDKAARLPLSVSDFVLGPVIAVLEGMSAVSASSRRFGTVFATNCKRMVDNVQFYAKQAAGVLGTQDPFINAMHQIVREGLRLLANPELNPTSVRARATDTANTHSNAATSLLTGTSRTANAGSPQLSPGSTVSEALVQPGDDIRALAARLLGDRMRYQELVVLNSLVAPYVSTTPAPGVLSPGSRILYADASGTATTQVSPISETATSSVELAYGRDLRLTRVDNGLSGAQYDIAVTPNGTVETVEGVNNLVQALTIKFATAAGELPLHPSFGAVAIVGSKATPKNLAGLKLDTEQTLLADTRVKSILQLRYNASGDTLVATARLAIRGTSKALNLQLPLRTA